MELRHMRYFIAVAEELNFTKAAEKLYIAQPSLSKQIKDLEDELGAQLLVRDKRHVMLTNAGSEFLKYAYETLEVASRAIIRTKQTLIDNKSKITISMNSAAEHFLISKIFDYIEKKSISLDLHSNTCFKNILELKNAEVDLCFSRLELQDNEFKSKLIKQEDVFIVYKNKSTDLNSSYIEFPKSNDPLFHEQVKLYIERNKIDISKYVTNSNLFQFLNIFQKIDGWSIVPEHIVKLLVCNCEKVDFKVPIYVSFKRNSRKEHHSFIENCFLIK